MADIFVSYAREDEARVRPIVEKLLAPGWSVFWDRRIPVGKTWHSVLETKLRESRCVLAAWSHASVKSEWVLEEAMYAKSNHILVPLLLDKVQPPFGFSLIQAADLTAWNNDSADPDFRECIEAVSSMLSPLSREEGSSVTESSELIRNFLLVHGGRFLMGCPETEVERSDDETLHEVEVSDFWICKYALTVGEFRAFIKSTDYRTDAEVGSGSYIWNGKEWKETEGINWRHGVSGKERLADEENHPVLHVSWNDARACCEWFSKKTGKSFRLPTEAEWEYACRAGTRTPFNTGENLTTKQANYDGNFPYKKHTKGEYRQKTVAVESFEPNKWGLYNMHGNVWEWCSDWYGSDYYKECKAQGVSKNSQGPATGSSRVLRGGGGGTNAVNCRSAFRNPYTPGYRNSNVGFRLVFVP